MKTIRRLYRILESTVRQLYGGVKATVRDSLPLAAALTICSLITAAALVLWLTGRPTGGDWWDIHYDTLEWKDRLTIAGAVAAGAGAAIALVVSYRKQRDAEEGKFSHAFAEAAAQLGDTSAAVRMAGAYALAALGDRYADRRQQCIDALCGYLRLNYTPKADTQNLISTTWNREVGGSTISDTINYRAGDREVRLTIIRIIRDHLRNEARTGWWGYDLDFTGATFDGGDFRNATFVSGITRRGETGRVSFEGATFLGGRVSFEGATFPGGRVSFEGATFAGGRVSFEGATFTASLVSFRGAAFLDGRVSFDRASFSGLRVRFDGATFSGGHVWFGGAAFLGGQTSLDEETFSSSGRVGMFGAPVPFGEEWTGSARRFSSAGATLPTDRVWFDGATFSTDRVWFDGAEFLGGLISFDGATFSDGLVSFNESRFRGGEVTAEAKALQGVSSS